MPLVYLNGEFKPLTEANINVLDRGFTLGDGVYEVIPVFNRTLFRFEEHLRRLSNSLRAIYMDNPYSDKEWHSIFIKLIESNTDMNQSIYLQVTRGISYRDHDIALADKPTIFVMSRPILEKDFSNTGIKVIIHEDIRWTNCNIKAITLLPNVLLRHFAKEQGAKEAILIRDGFVTEGAASNVFMIMNNVVYTPPKNNMVLPGITRDLILELLKKNNISCKEEKIKEIALYNAEEIWITSSTWDIVPVVKIGERLVNDGKIGPVWYRTNALYQKYKQDCCI